MTRMRLGAATVFLCLAVTRQSTLAAGAEQHAEFSEADVRVNVNRYLHAVFGKTVPSLATYNSYEGPHDEAEYRLEIVECLNRWAKAFDVIAGREVLTPKCKEWILKRGEHPESERSLYYAALRQRLGLVGAQLRIDSVRRPHEAGGSFSVTVTCRRPRVTLDLYHARDPEVAELGLLGILKVNGRPVDKVVPAPQRHY